MPGTVSAAFLTRATARRDALITEAENWTRSLPEGKLSPAAEVRYRSYVSDIEALTRLSATPNLNLSAWVASHSGLVARTSTVRAA